MALYYFDIDDNGSMHVDDHGTDCPDFARVKKEAISALVDIIKESLPMVIIIGCRSRSVTMPGQRSCKSR